MEFRDFSFWTIIPHSAQQFHTSPSVVYLPSTREFVPRSEYHFCYHCVIRHAHYYMRSSAPWVRHLCSSLVVLNTLAVRDEDASRMERTAALALLGLAPAATVQDIKTAYKKLVLQWHPDKHAHDRERTTQVFVNISEAYHVLLDDLVEEEPELSRVTFRARRPPTPFFIPQDLSFESESESEEEDQFNETFSCSGDGSEPRTPPTSEPSSPFFYSPYLPLSPLSEDVFPGPCLQSLPDLGPLDPNEDQDAALPYQTPPMVYRVPEYIMPRAHTYPSFEKTFTWHRGTFPSSDWSSDAGPSTRTHSSTYHETASRPRRQLTRPSLDPYSDHWICTLQLSLSDLFTGKKCHFELHRHAAKRWKRSAVVDFVVQPGTTDGTTFFCRGMGNERPDGTFQDVVFLVEELPHCDFARVGNDLILDMVIPPGALGLDNRRSHIDRSHHKLRKRTAGGSHVPDAQPESYVKITGFCGEEYLVDTGCLWRNSTEGKARRSRRGVHVVLGAGMPVREIYGRNQERGNLIVRWECPVYAPSRWRLFKDMFHDVVTH